MPQLTCPESISSMRSKSLLNWTSFLKVDHTFKIISHVCNENISDSDSTAILTVEDNFSLFSAVCVHVCWWGGLLYQALCITFCLHEIAIQIISA